MLQIVVRKFDTGQPPTLVEHLFKLEGGHLYHLTDGAFRAKVPPEGFADFASHHPEAVAVLADAVPDIEQKAREAMIARARRASVDMEKPVSANQTEIDRLVEAAVAKATARFEETLAAALAAKTAPATVD